MAKVNFFGVFPFCATLATDGSLVGEGTPYPIGFSLEDAAYIFWKAKSFQSEITYWDSNQTGTVKENVILPYYDHVFPAPHGKTFVPKSEIDFVCYNKAPIVWWNGETIARFSFNFYTTNNVSVYLYNNKYYLAISFSIPNGNSRNLIGESAKTTTISLEVNSSSYDIKFYYPNGIPTASTGIIKISEVWPYNS